MGRERKGMTVFRDGRWHARAFFQDQTTGKWREKWKVAENKTHAKQLLREMYSELDLHGPATLELERRTFHDLAEMYQQRYLVPPVYVQGRKVAGLRSHEESKALLRPLVAFFGRRLIRSVTFADLEDFKQDRLRTPSKRGQRLPASVNRELALLRRMLMVAHREGWILKNPFHAGDSLISTADERQRDRVLTKEEETRLLEACSAPKCGHLRAVLIFALDTGCRFGEIRTLSWSDFDFESGIITIQALNAKTARQRKIKATGRVMTELRNLWDLSAQIEQSTVFGIATNIKRSFETVCRIAGVEGFQFRDCRHTFATRLHRAGLQIAEVARLLGHADIKTTYRYLNLAPDTLDRAADILDRINDHRAPKRTTDEPAA